MPRNTLILATLLLVAPLSAYGQACGGTVPEAFNVVGRVIAPGVTWDEYYEVLQLNETQLVGYGYTDSTGMFRLPDQPAGQYYIVVRIDGFKEFRERTDVFGCQREYPFQIFMEFEDEVIRPVILDFTGEVKELVDVAELKRMFPRKTVEEFERAQTDRLRGEPDRAMKRLETLLRETPDFYDGFNALGSVYLEMKRYREAEAQYNKARDLNPNSAAPLVSLGSLYMMEADASEHPTAGVAGVLLPGGDQGVILDDARSVLEEAVKIRPDASFAYYLLGVAHFKGGNAVPAEVNLRKALSIESRLRWARIALANLYMKQHRWKEALAEFDAYLTEFPRVANRDEVRAARAKVAAQLAGVVK